MMHTFHYEYWCRQNKSDDGGVLKVNCGQKKKKYRYCVNVKTSRKKWGHGC